MTKQYAWMTVKGWEPEDGIKGHFNQPKLISEFCRDFNTAASAIDPNFGILRLNLPPDESMYTLMIEPAEAERLAREYPGRFDGPWQDYTMVPK